MVLIQKVITMFDFIKKYKKEIIHNLKIWSPMIFLFLYFIVLFVIGVKNFFSACVILICIISISSIFYRIYEEFKNPIVRRIFSCFDDIEKVFPDFEFYKTIYIDIGCTDIDFKYGFTGIVNNMRYTFADYVDMLSKNGGFIIKIEPFTQVDIDNALPETVESLSRIYKDDMREVRIKNESILIFFNTERFQVGIQTVRNKKTCKSHILIEIRKIREILNIVNKILEGNDCD